MKISRNALCPCGSGKKYKHCCGSLATKAQTELQSVSVKRQCGECTGCCDGWVRIVVYGHEVYPGKPCPFSTGHNCSIYARRPQDPCRDFICGWLAEGSFLPDWFRPDKAGCLVLPEKLTWDGWPVDVVVPVGARIKPKSLAWLKRHAADHSRLLLYSDGDELWNAYGPPEFQQDMAERFEQGEKFW